MTEATIEAIIASMGLAYFGYHLGKSLSDKNRTGIITNVIVFTLIGIVHAIYVW